MRQGRSRRRFLPLLELVVGLALLGAAVGITVTTHTALASTPTPSASYAAVNVGGLSATNIGQSPDVRPVVQPETVAPGRAARPLRIRVPKPEVKAPTAPVGIRNAVNLGVRPQRIRIPRLGIDAPVVPVSISPSGSLQIPSDPWVVGWWADGARPGAGRGTAIMAGHVNTAALGPGVFSNLGLLQPGDEITIVGPRRELRFRLVGLAQYPKSELPASAAFSQEVEGRLAIVTCGGPFIPSIGHYRDNIIAYAVPAAVKSAPSAKRGP